MSIEESHGLLSWVKRQPWFREKSKWLLKKWFWKQSPELQFGCSSNKFFLFLLLFFPPLVVFPLPVCLVAFSWITWSISVFHQPAGPQCVFIYAVFARRATSPCCFHPPLQEQLVQHEALIWTCSSVWWCHHDAIMYRSVLASSFFLIIFPSPLLLGFTHSTGPCRGPDTGAQLLPGLKDEVVIFV